MAQETNSVKPLEADATLWPVEKPLETREVTREYGLNWKKKYFGEKAAAAGLGDGCACCKESFCAIGLGQFEI